MISEELVFSSSDQFEVMAVQKWHDQVVLCVQSRNKGCPCPGCNVFSNRLHSYYIRKVKDLPAFDNKVSLHVKAKKWYCHNADCTRKVFTERFNYFLKPYKRTSDRLREKLLKVALLTGGNPGKKICGMLNIIVSSSSLIRLIDEQQVLAPVSVPTPYKLDGF